MSIGSAKKKRSRWIKILAGLAVVVAAVIGLGWYKLFREVPQTFASAEEYFKYGSIGTESEEGLPYWVWLVLPRMFPEYLPGPGGYRSLGVAWEQGSETPVGFSKKIIGFPRIGINCALCHTATYRTRASTKTQIVPTGPTQVFDSQKYILFLSAAASDPRFNADNVLKYIEYNVELSWLDHLLYRFFIIPRTRDGLLEQGRRYAWTYDRPRWGPGRIDPFNPVKFHPHLLGLDPKQDRTVGNSDVMPIWRMRDQKGYALHWDGLNRSLIEVILSGAIGDGARPASLPVDKLKGLEIYLRRREAPTYPFTDSLDAQQVARGEVIFNQYCANCHAPYGSRTGTAIALDEIGTDRHRLDMWTEQAAQRYNEYAADYSWDFNAFVKTNGYVAKPLTGLWLRAPYLHNGSVPTLQALLEPASRRPRVFYRGYDLYQPGGTGFVHEGEQAERYDFKYNTRVPGNSNKGHEGPQYGTELPAGQKRDLIEYLKTL